MLLDEIRQRWIENGVPVKHPVIRFKGESVSLDDIFQASHDVAFSIPSGSVVAHIGDFTPADIAILLQLIDQNCIIAPLTDATSLQHEMFFGFA